MSNKNKNNITNELVGAVMTENHLLEVIQQADYMLPDYIKLILDTNNISYTEDDMGNIYNIIEGRPAVCAHMDNVGSTTANGLVELASFYNLKEGKERCIANLVDKVQYNIGADDKVGVAISLYNIIYSYNINNPISFIFTVDEEIGCVGARHLCKTIPEEIKKIPYILIADRKGNSDIIGTMNDYCTKEFIDIIKPIYKTYGYKEVAGVLCDQDQFNEYTNGINISCGYYNAHSDNEYIVISESIKCCSLVNDLLFNESLQSIRDNKLEPVVIDNSWKYSKGSFGRGSYDVRGDSSSRNNRGNKTDEECYDEEYQEVYLPTGTYRNSEGIDVFLEGGLYGVSMI